MERELLKRELREDIDAITKKATADIAIAPAITLCVYCDDFNSTYRIEITIWGKQIINIRLPMIKAMGSSNR